MSGPPTQGQPMPRHGRTKTYYLEKATRLRDCYEPIPADATSMDTDKRNGSRIRKHTPPPKKFAIGRNVSQTPLKGVAELRREVADRQAIERGENEGMRVGHDNS